MNYYFFMNDTIDIIFNRFIRACVCVANENAQKIIQ